MNEIVIDLDELLERVQDDKELLVELFDLFIEDFEMKRGLLSTVIAESDYDQIKGIAHSLKGSAGNLSAKSLRESIIQLETMAQAHDLSDIHKVLTDMDERFGRLLERMMVLKKEFQR